AISSFKGKAPKDIEAIIKAYTEKAEISWQEALKKIIPSLRAGEKKTVTRRNRRQPERLDIRGTLPNSIPEVIVAIDISASMSEEEVHKIMIEILEITKTRTNKITVIECDNEIRRVYEIKSKNDIKKRTSN
ncbi:VWA-like domain-containing protein, partial [Clostridium perfringens]